MFFATKNTITSALDACPAPWDFKPTETITLQIRKVKEDRQDWYNNPDTQHNFYTAIEPLNPNLRVSKENRPLKIWGVIGDYDVEVPEERIDEALALMKIKPAYVERSLGGNFRLIWIFPHPLWVDGLDFCKFFLMEARKWLKVGLLPGLDEPAFENPTRLYCNGCDWKETGHGPVKESDLQAFFVACGRKFRFVALDSEEVPLEVVEKALKEKFSRFNWPDAFALDSQGPSFWIPESVSPLSAIVKPGGMFTFSAHAERPFYTWGQILGEEFVKNFQNDAISKATKDCYYDGRMFWHINHGVYVPDAKGDMADKIEIQYGVTSKPPKGGTRAQSPLAKAMHHIMTENRVVDAAPFVFQKPGLLLVRGERRLNTYNHKPLEPASGTQKFGPHGNAPMLSALLTYLHAISPMQFQVFMAWLSQYYKSAYFWEPVPGQWVLVTGVPSCGKTFTNRHFIGGLVGGFTDGTRVLVGGSQFTATVLSWPHICIDDDSMSGGSRQNGDAMERFKAWTANQEQRCEEKFQKSTHVEHMGRIMMTMNLDFTSLRLLNDLSNSAMDKVHMFRGPEDPKNLFPFPSSRIETMKKLNQELPFMGRILLDWQVPDDVPRCPRYGYAAYHDQFLMDRVHQGSPNAPFREILLKSLSNWFAANPEATEFRGTCTEIYSMLMQDGINAIVLRHYNVDKVNRYLENLEKLELIPPHVDGDEKSRVWVFPAPPRQAPPTPPAPPQGPNPFDK